jgi:hypothetical protein
MSTLLGLGTLVGDVGKVADDLFTSDEERLKIALEERTLDAELVKGQLEVNKVEAAHQSLFVAGWRPFVGWIGAVALVYQFILYPLFIWGWTLAKANGMIDAGFETPPVLDGEALFALITGMLGIAGLRSFDKTKGTATTRIK